MRLLPFFLVFVGCKEITATIVGGTVEAGKEVTSGIVEGVEKGRKQGESVDGAVLVTNHEELAANGGVTVFAVRAAGTGSEVVLAFTNAGEKPLRVSGVETLVLDPDGFAQHPSGRAEESITVPPRAKDQLVVAFDVTPDRVKGVRVWGADLVVPAATTP